MITFKQNPFGDHLNTTTFNIRITDTLIDGQLVIIDSVGFCPIARYAILNDFIYVYCSHGNNSDIRFNKKISSATMEDWVIRVYFDD